MWPWGHLAVGYLCYVAFTYLKNSTANRRSLLCLLAVGLGTQFPDLVDKPLAWTFNILPSGRSLTHSLLIAVAVIVFVSRIAAPADRTRVRAPFAIGYLSHLLTDLGPGVIIGLLRGDLSQLQWTTYLLWPLLPAPPYPNDGSFLQHFLMFEFESYVLFQFVLFGLAVVVWIVDGTLGVGQLWRLVMASRRRLNS